MQSVSVAPSRATVDPDKFMPWISDLTQREGPNILRCKGILAFPDEPKRFVFQGVHMILDGDLQRDWKAGEKRESRVVFIGRDLDEDAIREGVLSCAAESLRVIAGLDPAISMEGLRSSEPGWLGRARP